MGAKRQAKKQLEIEREVQKQRAAEIRKTRESEAKRSTKEAKRKANQEAFDALSPKQQRNAFIAFGVVALLVVVFVVVAAITDKAPHSDSPKSDTQVEDCVKQLRRMSSESGKSVGELAQTLAGSRDPEEACRRNFGR